MSNHIKVLLVGCGYMGVEYAAALKGMGIVPTVVGRSKEKVLEFQKKTGLEAISGGIEAAINGIAPLPQYAIVATQVSELSQCTVALLNAGVEKILVEKPAGITREEIAEIHECVVRNHAEVFVAYNRRFYASTERAMEIIEQDGGISSFHFEFTEWASEIEQLSGRCIEKENLLLANSTHVIDLAFFLGGNPVEMVSYIEGEMPWHSRGSVFTGAGKTAKGALFSYHADWAAPGRWSVEVLTKDHRLYFKPMEKLGLQKLGSIEVKEVEIDDSLDQVYKPGLYKQLQAFFFNRMDNRLIDIKTHLEKWDFYLRIGNYHDCGN